MQIIRPLTPRLVTGQRGGGDPMLSTGIPEETGERGSGGGSVFQRGKGHDMGIHTEGYQHKHIQCVTLVLNLSSFNIEMHLSV